MAVSALHCPPGVGASTGRGRPQAAATEGTGAAGELNLKRMRTPTDLVRLSERQRGVVSRAQARAAGLSAKAIQHRIEYGVWQPVLPRVYATFSGPVPFATRMWAAVLYAGTGAVVSHASAAHAIGWSATPDLVDVIVPVERRVREQPSLRIHRCSLEPHDIAHVRRLPATAPMRTVLDLLSGARTADDALGIAANAVGSRRVSAQRLLAGLRERPNARHRAVLLDALQDVAGGSDSILEVKFAQLLRRHGLPLGVRQQRMRHGERTIRVDMAWPGLVVELDGLLGHAHYGGRFRDAGRDNGHALAGRSVLRFGWSDVTTDACTVAAQVAALLGTTKRRCGPGCAART
ncbi:MAG: hypothetical protein QOI42_588 [Frankiaceae bacterium]|nr:hypothetical protein [Frankiaceae bacterium]